MCCFAVADAAIGLELQPHALAPLFTYYYELSEPTVRPSARTAVRPGRTALTVSYSEPKVSRHMPVTVPDKQGTVHDVINTWQALKVSRHDSSTRSASSTASKLNSEIAIIVFLLN